MAKKQKNLGGRPQAIIDWQKVDAMLQIQCTGEEIASVLDVDYNTVDRHCKLEKKMGFEEYSVIKKQGGKASLRRRQWMMAEKNPAMAIWLGKQYLGQRDKFETENTNHFPQAIEISFTSTNENKG